jgi:phage/plasmid-like protein (TIGR03299 family)
MTDIRTATWTNIGYDIRKATTVEEALKLSHLDYTVEKVPCFLADGTPIPGAFCTKKENSLETFGVVGKEFSIIQNIEGFDFINALVGEGLTFLKAGENRKMVWIIGQLPTIDILGDKITPHVIFQNSHGGNTTLKATIAPLRIICQNQFNLTFRKADNKISLRHTSSIKDRLHTAETVLAQNSIYLDEFKKKAEEMASAKVSKNQVDSLLDGIFEVKADFNPTQVRRMEEKRERFLAAYQAEDNQNFIGTQWGLINAYTDFVTHKPLRKNTEQARENHFIKTTLKGSIDDFVRTVSKLG